MKSRVVVVGASGRVGSKVLELLHSSKYFSVVGAVVSPDSKLLNESVFSNNADQDLRFTSDHRAAISKADLVIDFSIPSSTIEAAKFCYEYKVPYVCATTGLSSEDRVTVDRVAQVAPLVVAPNTSLGVFVLEEVSKLAKNLLGEDFDCEILEAHHSNKKDAPSGTALRLKAALQFASHVTDRETRSMIRPKGELGISVIRGGDIIGDHTVYFLGDGERLELSHKASNRDLFARGALLLGRRLLSKMPGSYTAGELFKG